ncbi:MAG: DUF72 domain-containing protein [Cellvibrionaceae bacterium]|nr:DUF72 domain-containing protein [Cellvibrionaceae bacterium]
MKLRHALEVRNDTFAVPEFAALARKYGAAIVYAHHEKYPEIADVTADFVYARLQRGSDDNENCYTDKELDGWAKRAGNSGPRAASRTTYPMSTRQRRRKRSRATCSSTSSPRARCALPFGAMALQKRVDS